MWVPTIGGGRSLAISVNERIPATLGHAIGAGVAAPSFHELISVHIMCNANADTTVVSLP
jgi:hypothetical protein